MVFCLPRPKFHFGQGQNSDKIRPNAPSHPITKPDLDKLTRLVLDALTDIVWHDDAQVQTILTSKFYGGLQTGVEITVQEEGDEQ